MSAVAVLGPLAMLGLSSSVVPPSGVLLPSLPHLLLGPQPANGTVQWTGEGTASAGPPAAGTQTAGTPTAKITAPAPVVISSQAQVRLADAAAPPPPATASRVNLDLRDADIRGVLRLLAAAGDFDFAMSDELTATVDVQLRDVPWDVALHTILRLEGLQAQAGVGGILVISVADKPGAGG